MLFGFDDSPAGGARANDASEPATDTTPLGQEPGTDTTLLDQEPVPHARQWWPMALVGLLGLAIGLAAWALLADNDQALTQADLDQAVADAVESTSPTALSAGEVFNQIAPSLVVVRALSNDPAAPANIGAGIVINERGQVLTANHVITGAASLELDFSDGTTTAATIESENPSLDMAVLSPVGTGGIRVPAVLGNARTLAVGDTVHAVGNPLGLTGSISSGVISGLNRDIPTPGVEDAVFEDLIQFDAAVNQGSSGGPLLNSDGQVIGIVTALADPTGEGFFIGIGFAVPIDIAAASVANRPSQ